MKYRELADKIWYFEDVIENSDQITSSLEGWMDTENQEYMKNINMPTANFLEVTDEATFRVLDIWYNQNLEINADNYKLMGMVQWWKRGAGTGFTPHTDFARNPIDQTFVDAHITVLGYYSDTNDYEGGEICFDDYDVCIKPAQGSMIVMGHKAIHSVKPVISGTRIISNQHLVKTKDFYKCLGLEEFSLTKQDQIRIRKEYPQYENKNGNVRLSSYSDDENKGTI